MANKTTFIATGDSFMTRRLPENGYPGFEKIQEIIGYDTEDGLRILEENR